MADAEPSSNPAEKEQKPPEGLSQFIGKVLDQLSLSAWMPAAMLVGCGAVLLQLRSQGNFDLGAAVVGLTAKPLGILVVLLFALVLAALVSQAFSFSAIRFFEGYWKGPLVWLGVYRIMVRYKARRWHRLTDKLQEQTNRAFETARRAMLDNNRYELAFVRLVEEVFRQDEVPDTPEYRAAQSFDWRRVLPPDVASREFRLAQAQREYPFPHRMLPTKLGNILRATEDRISRGQDTQDLMLRRGEDIPARLRLHHDQFRTRLDMYCTLIFVHLGLAALTIALLVPARNSLLGTAVTTTVFLLLAIASYSAAIASARGYCTTLKVIFSVPTAG
ncbi:hypothetical protein [Amycolatopsis sp. Hca4]|uniref:hypothetical protein n=1 Tax=Amycolatopsis sp. Hca4 TaxID=2742131 RepID=UPI0015903460|nr:hypothetical protein [Amycolatopsis sp. Hca4]QKV74961.1 hypothetical protein HUT10_15180 [Amycolatopsis sp. Hca4]